MLSCNSDSSEQDSDTRTTAASNPDTLCYLRTAGINNVDTAAIKLVIADHEVTGEMKYLPYEKDARTGPLRGSIEGDILTLEHLCSQEGMEFTVPVVLQMSSNSVLQKGTAFNDAGEEYIPKDATFETEYKQVDCSIFPERDY